MYSLGSRSINIPVVILLLFACSVAAPLLAQQAQPSDRAGNAQAILTLLATPRPINPAGSKIPIPPPNSSFASWTPEQQNILPRQILGRCTAAYGMMNPNGTLHLLPAAQDPLDAGKLAVEVCSIANLPADWPPHPSVVADVHRILARSAQLGEPLTLPPSFPAK